MSEHNDSDFQFPYAIEDLTQDVEEAANRLRSLDTAFNRRTYVRALFAFLEGFTYAIRQETIRLMHLNIAEVGKPLNIDRLILLREVIPDVEPTGKVKHKQQRTPSVPLFAFSLRSFAEPSEVDPIV